MNESAVAILVVVEKVALLPPQLPEAVLETVAKSSTEHLEKRKKEFCRNYDMYIYICRNF